jgi:hypothetical protein
MMGAGSRSSRSPGALLVGALLVTAWLVAPGPPAGGKPNAGSVVPEGLEPRCVSINRILYDPPGKDTRKNASLVREWIQVTNSCAAAASISGWRIRNSNGRTYTFRDLSLVGGGLIRVYTGRGANTPTYRYWGKRRHIWNDRRDTARLIDADGVKVHACSYEGRPAGNVLCARYDPPSTESEHASFRVECELSHRKQVDPIVAPGPKGTPSAHMHDFFGNSSVDSDSTYGAMLRADTTCGLSTDTAGYWVPSLVGPDDHFVEPDRMIVYYRPRPIDYGTTIPFPPDLRVVAGGSMTYPHAYWTCDGQSDSALESRAETVPDCGSADLKLHVFFPSCWDGLRNDSTDHRQHLAYAFDEDDGTSTDISDDTCPRSHPVKIPQVHVRVIFPISDGPAYNLADHETSPHADLWNTWHQAPLERLISTCLRVGVSCELQED